MAVKTPADDDMLLLYALRRPFTNINTRDVGAFVDIGIDIKHAFVGTIRVRAEDLAEVLLHIFANGRAEIGFITRGKIHWMIDPSIVGHVVVIDQFGVLHDVQQLGEGI